MRVFKKHLQNPEKLIRFVKNGFDVYTELELSEYREGTFYEAAIRWVTPELVQACIEAGAHPNFIWLKREVLPLAVSSIITAMRAFRPDNLKVLLENGANIGYLRVHELRDIQWHMQRNLLPEYEHLQDFRKPKQFNIINAIFGGVGEDGRGYVSSSDISKWAKDFRLMPLHHSWLNIAYDMENDLRGAEGVFKKVVAGEILEDSYKHKDPIPFKTRSKLMMACNFFPQGNDTSDGFMRRWLIVELPMHFVEKGKVRPCTNDRELDPFLEDKLMKELSGILNWMIEGLQRLIRQKGFTHTANQDRLINEFRAANNPLYSFVEEKHEMLSGSDEGHIVPRYSVFNIYSEWADKNKILPLPSNRFYSNMRSIFNNLSMPFDEDEENWIFYFKENEGAENW